MEAAQINPGQLQKKVQKLCAAQARKVQVLLNPDRSIRVVVEVADPTVEKGIIDKVLDLPDFGAPGVHLEVRVAQ
jgi:hypothetical protein